MAITPLPIPPSRNDPEATFVARANAFLAALPTLAIEIDSTVAVVDAASASALLSASNAAAQVALATTQANAASASAGAAANSASAAFSASSSSGYKGEWASLSGALALPASVAHEGAFYALVEPLANVALAEPGVSPAWVIIGGDVAGQSILFSFFFS